MKLPTGFGHQACGLKNGLIPLLALITPLGGCEPLRGVVANRDSTSVVDIACIDKGLRQAFGQIERWDYVSDGGDYPKGTNVAQFAYFSTENRRGTATLEIGTVHGRTRLKHSFTGIGSEIPQEDFDPAFRAMKRASSALYSTCKLDLENMPFKAVGQEVDALKLLK